MVLGSERDGLKYFNSRLSISAHGGCDEDIEGMRGADHHRRFLGYTLKDIAGHLRIAAHNSEKGPEEGRG